MAIQQTWFMVIVILCCLGQNDTLDIRQTCQPQASCSECLRSPGCAWCKQRDFLKPGESNERRCDSAESLSSRSCKERHVINPKPLIDVMKDKSLTDRDDVIQLKPQSVELKLRIGQPQEFKVIFKRAQGYPIDLYYLMDLSFSMKDDLDKIKNLGHDILKTLGNFTKDIHIGFGSFVDKVALPYVSQLRQRKANPCPNRMEKCQPAFSFRNILPLTQDADKFQEEVSKQKISGNLDSPEAGLDAIMQTAVCQEIGWRLKSNRILVYTSDDTFHMAGDGRLAGIYRPHDGQCHLNKSVYNGTFQDYPSIGHLSTVLQSNNIQLIFAVTEEIYTAYEALRKLIPGSVVGELNNDSSNVVKLISDAYTNLSSTIVFEHEQAPAEVSISYRSSCGGGQWSDWRTQGECNGIKLDQQVEFIVRFNATACLTGRVPIKIKVQGIDADFTAFVETLCDCDCQDQENKSSHCSGNGTFQCGMCSCDDKYLGQKCECQLSDDFDSMKAMSALCRQNTSDICGGHGTCECGKCACHNHYRGDYCECDDNSCPQVNKKMCNGKGSCHCGQCQCNEGYAGEMCHCPPKEKRDCGEKGGKPCNGHGKCPCDQCICKEGMAGTYCDRVQEPCGMRYQSCMVCAAQGGSCKKECEDEGLTAVKMDGPQEYACVHEGLTFYVNATHDGTHDGRIKIHYADLPRSIDKTSVIIGSSVTGIVVIGIVIIIVYRLLIELYDLKEYRSFLRAQEMTDWKDTHNPLFQGATTTVMNPLHDDVE